jgi:sugar phosphate isomerase/epimerase
VRIREDLATIVQLRRLGRPRGSRAPARRITYCTNIHAGESWAEVRTNLECHVLAVRRRVAPAVPFGVGLRLSARAADELTGASAKSSTTLTTGTAGSATAQAAPALIALREFLAEHRLYVFTLNGFPYGPFHGAPVKEEVYRPDWLEEARLTYSDRLAWILADLLPDDPTVSGSVSTVPGAFKPRVRSDADVDAMIDRLLRHAATLHQIRERTGKVVMLALEPEPYCHCETVAETVAFFARVFAHRSVERLARLTGLGSAASAEALHRHLGICFDACHMAVEFESPRRPWRHSRRRGIGIGKIQISAGLEVDVSSRDPDTLRALASFAEGVYLHQVVARVGGKLHRYLDLPDALGAAVPHPPAAAVVHDRTPGNAPNAPPITLERDSELWRIHFHVPLFREQLGHFRSTQPYVRTLLDLVRRDALTAPPGLHLGTCYRRNTAMSRRRRGRRELEWVQRHLRGAPRDQGDRGATPRRALAHISSPRAGINLPWYGRTSSPVSLAGAAAGGDGVRARHRAFSRPTSVGCS